MSTSYRAVQWNRHKRFYDAVLVGCVALYLVAFVLIGKTVAGGMSDEILLIRGLGSCAILMLHLVLCIGPLARLSSRFAPLLYNRRHFGVTSFVVGLAHGGLMLVWYHGFGDVSPLVSLFASNTRYDSLTAFPFETLGFVALVILFLMAATSHDFWLVNLAPPVWKALHMLVYLAYGLLVMHVVLGVIQTERSLLYPVALGVGAVIVVTLHLAAGLAERRVPVAAPVDRDGGSWIDVGDVDRIPMDAATVVSPPDGERIAVYRHEGGISAISNVCAHQNGPLGEGRIVDGCVTCPWHGYQYRPGDGTSPPPFTEKVPTYRVHVEKGRVLVDPDPLAPGTAVDPARVEGGADA
ncbi:MAG: (2Fe-2S)-binding protein [Phycisphaeraceae bacterium]|nr:(2Fe-2S)-binding protein [Phycisphaeraceae bacterium]